MTKRWGEPTRTVGQGRLVNAEQSIVNLGAAEVGMHTRLDPMQSLLLRLLGVGLRLWPHGHVAAAKNDDVEAHT